MHANAITSHKSHSRRKQLKDNNNRNKAIVDSFQSENIKQLHGLCKCVAFVVSILIVTFHGIQLKQIDTPSL